MKDPRHCAHSSINRKMDSWICNDCGAEFVPKNRSFRTKWSDDQPEDLSLQARRAPETVRREINESLAEIQKKHGDAWRL